MGKLFERVFKHSIDNVISKRNLIPEMHSGFRSGRSCQENFLRLSEGIAEGLKRNKTTIGAFVDLDKAFDAVSHDSLRIKIIRQQLPPKIIRTISSFLRDRFLYVAEGEIRSEEILMLGGTPQGSILSPTLFILLSADAPVISDGVEEDGSIFADDITLWCSASSVDDCINLLQRRLNLFADWCQKWRLSPSPTKSNVIVFSRKKSIRENVKKRSLYLYNAKIPWTTEVSYLGAKYDECFNFKSHIDSLILRSHIKIRGIRKLTSFGLNVNQDLIISLLHSLVFSNFNYSAPAYLGISPLVWRKVDSFFAKSLKSIFHHPSFVSNELILHNYLGRRASDIILDQCTNRIRSILHKVPLAADVVPRISDCIFNRPPNSPIETILRRNHVNSNENCLTCICGIGHACVPIR